MCDNVDYVTMLILFDIGLVSIVPVLLYSFVFFFKQKTAYEMRISDWSSDVCSSDLKRILAAAQSHFPGEVVEITTNPDDQSFDIFVGAEREIGRASCRERVCQYV